MNEKKRALEMFDHFREIESRTLRKLASVRHGMEELKTIKTEINGDTELKAAFAVLVDGAGRSMTAMMKVPTDLASVATTAEGKFPQLLPPEPEPEPE